VEFTLPDVLGVLDPVLVDKGLQRLPAGAGGHHLVVGLDLHRPGVFQVGNCSLTELATDRAGRLVLVRHNDMCHLEGLETTVDRG
jgi:hypothetical protein